MLLFNADHHWMNPVLTEFGSNVAGLLAGERPVRIPFVGMFPWLLRAQVLIPLLQLIDVGVTLGMLRNRRLDSEPLVNSQGLRGLRLLLPLTANLLVALSLIPMFGRSRKYLQLYMPDFAWLACFSGSFALIWSLLRTGLLLGLASRTKPSSSKARQQLTP